MSFWKSDLGEITGSPSDAFMNFFELIPHGTKALCSIEKAYNHEDDYGKYICFDRKIIAGDFLGKKITQKLNVFLGSNVSDGAKWVHKRDLNMLKFLYNLHGVKPENGSAPTNEFLSIFSDKKDGIVIIEKQSKKSDKTFNQVGEVHPEKGFISETGIKLVVTKKPASDYDSWMGNNPSVDSVPFFN